MAEEKKKEAPKPKAGKPKGKKFKAYAKGRYCPKCGVGIRLAEHKDRLACGKCGYLESKAKA